MKALKSCHFGQSFYLDYNILIAITKEREELLQLWNHYEEGTIKLVTCLDDTTMEIIYGLERVGCYVWNARIDQLQKAIEKYARWEKAYHRIIDERKRCLDYLRKVNHLQLLIDPRLGNYGLGAGPMGLSDTKDRLLRRIRDCLKQEKNEKRNHLEKLKRIHIKHKKILIDCITQVGEIYSNDSQWRNTKILDFNYDGHWDLLARALQKCGRQACINRREHRNLFAKLTRLINYAHIFGYGPTSFQENEIDRLMERLEQWVYDSEVDVPSQKRKTKGLFSHWDRDARHIFHCIEHKINNFLTMDNHIYRIFTAVRKPEFESFLTRRGSNLNVIRPVDLFDDRR